jgi:hypothetical protein
MSAFATKWRWSARSAANPFRFSANSKVFERPDAREYAGFYICLTELHWWKIGRSPGEPFSRSGDFDGAVRRAESVSAGLHPLFNKEQQRAVSPTPAVSHSILDR